MEGGWREDGGRMEEVGERREERREDKGEGGGNLIISTHRGGNTSINGGLKTREINFV
jgi:hypothetical protein